MRIQYLGYLVIAGAIYAGYAPWHPASVLGFALVSTLIFVSSRLQALKQEPHREKPNLLLDGAYLYAGQVLIMFIAYLAGWFYVNQFGGGA